MLSSASHKILPHAIPGVPGIEDARSMMLVDQPETTPDTWGISGPAFLAMYLVVLAGSALVAYLARRRADSIAAAPAPNDLSMLELAYVRDGGAHASFVALFHLVTVGAIVVRNDAADALMSDGHSIGRASRRDRARISAASTLELGRPLGADAEPLEDWMYREVASRPGIRPIDLVREGAAATESGAIETRLVAHHVLRPTADRRRMRFAALWFVPVIALGVIRLLAGIESDKPVGFLLILLGVTIALARRFARVDASSPSARRALEARSKDGELKAAISAPVTWPLAGAAASRAAMAVAVSGAALLWDAEPECAALLGAPLPAPTGGGWGGGCGGCGGCGGGCGG